MAIDQVKSSAIPYAGYEYQTAYGLKIVAEWLQAPTRYKKVRFECDDADEAPKGLDDIVAVRPDDSFEYWQVKYTPAPDKYPLSWDWLLEVAGKTPRSRPLVKKWFDALKKADIGRIASAQLVTNRIPDREIESCLDGVYLDYSKASAATREVVERALGNADNAKWLFKNLQIHHSDKSYLALRDTVTSELLRHSDMAGADRLKANARDWAILKNSPSPDGWITLALIGRILSTARPAPIPQDFSVPAGYQVPDEDFHLRFLSDVRSKAGKVLALVGPPGRGKSTYLSALCQALDTDGIPFVRHHYFLALADSTRDRRSSYIVTESLVGQVERFYGEAGVPTGGNTNIRDVVTACAEYYKSNGKPFVVVIDGLDHVWRDNADDKRPLDEVFEQLIPPPDNAVLVIGTQPVDDAFLPRRFVDAVSRTYWRELPPMSAPAVKAYLQLQVTAGRLKPVGDGDYQVELTECATALHALTKGHPLNVIFAIEQLANDGARLWAYDIEQLPLELGEDVRQYYASIWNRLSHAQRDMLYLLAALPFYWPRRAFAEIATLSGRAYESTGAIEHLLHSTDAGLKPFHESLVVFIKRQDEYEPQVEALLPLVERWLEAQAPDNLKNTWLWSVQAQLGRAEPLIGGLVRDWVLDRIAEGYPEAIPVRLLSDAESLAFHKKRYADAYRLRRLKTRLLNGPEFQITEVARLRACSWKLTRDNSVISEAFASRRDFNVKDLVALALALFWRGDKVPATQCASDAIRRHRNDSRYLVERNNSKRFDEVVALCKMVGCIDLLDDEKLGQSPVLSGTWVQPVHAFLAALAAELALPRLVDIARSAKRAFARKRAEDDAVRVSALNRVRLEEWSEFKGFRFSAMAGCWACLTKSEFERQPIFRRREKWQDSLRIEEQRDCLQELVHAWFFQTVLTALTASGEFCWIAAPPFARRPLVTGYLDHLTAVATAMAEIWRSKGSVEFADVFRRFESAPKPEGMDYDERQAYEDFRRALVPVARDCHLLSVAVGGASRVSAENVAAAETSHWFKRDFFLSDYVETGLPYLDDTAAVEIVNSRMAGLHGSISDTYERTKEVLESCELLLMHRMHDLARPLCRLCWDYVIGYGNHKDIAIISTLEAIGDLANIAPRQAREALASISAQVHSVTEYTDGDETRHAHSYVDDILAKVDQMAMVKKYDEHIASGNWQRADDTLKAFFETCDLRSVATESLARTGLPSSVLRVIKNRAEDGEDGAASILALAKAHLGTTRDAAAQEGESGPVKEDKGFEGKPQDYPPERFDALLADMRTGKSFDAHYYLPRWFEYWEKAGRGSVLLKLLTPDMMSEDVRAKDLQYVLDQAFELCIRLKGKVPAFALAVQAQIELGGWLEYFLESREKSEKRLKRVSELYADRADEFIQASAKTWMRHKGQPCPLVIPGDKLVHFLVQVKRIDEAVGLVQAMVTALQEETRNLPLTKPQWA